MNSQTNRQVRLKSRPTGVPLPDHFESVTAPLPEIGDSQFLVRNEYLSVEPAMRGWVSTTANYSTPVGIGDLMRGVLGRPDCDLTQSKLPRRRSSNGHAGMARVRNF